jgi:hypothetical protein
VPHPKPIVDYVSRFVPAYQSPSFIFINSSPEWVTVYFQNKEKARLNPNNPRSAVYAEIIEDLMQIQTPVYVELDPADESINRLLIPLRVRVKAIMPNPSGGMNVELEISQARHFLNPKNPDYDDLLDRLRTAQKEGIEVLVTETEIEPEIIDVRAAPVPFVLEPLEKPVASQGFELNAITSDRATDLFNIVSRKSCEPLTPQSSCIPFLFPRSGCWARAHQMCRLIIAEGEQPGKVWIIGNLEVRTENRPECKVNWGWHVAPTLQVTTGSTIRLLVIDPSIFKEPVRVSRWKEEHNDPAAEIVHTDASIYVLGRLGGPSTDPTYSSTKYYLEFFRNKLKELSLSPVGPPPYKDCG